VSLFPAHFHRYFFWQSVIHSIHGRCLIHFSCCFDSVAPVYLLCPPSLLPCVYSLFTVSSTKVVAFYLTMFTVTAVLNVLKAWWYKVRDKWQQTYTHWLDSHHHRERLVTAPCHDSQLPTILSQCEGCFRISTAFIECFVLHVNIFRRDLLILCFVFNCCIYIVCS